MAPRAGAASAHHRPRRGRHGRTDTRFIVTNLKVRNARILYEDVYCRRGQAENHIKSWKTYLAADRTSCTKATANQLQLFLHAGAYWLMWGLRVSMPKRSTWRVAQFDTLRLRLIELAARVVEMKTMIRFICRHHVPLRIFCVSRSPASRASSLEKRGGAPSNVEPVPSTRKPFLTRPLAHSRRRRHPSAGNRK